MFEFLGQFILRCMHYFRKKVLIILRQHTKHANFKLGVQYPLNTIQNLQFKGFLVANQLSKDLWIWLLCDPVTTEWRHYYAGELCSVNTDTCTLKQSILLFVGFKNYKHDFYIFTLCCMPGGGTQLWVGYGCAARSFDHHPITKPEKMQICNLYPNLLFLEGPFFKQISTFYHVNWDA